MFSLNQRWRLSLLELYRQPAAWTSHFVARIHNKEVSHHTNNVRPSLTQVLYVLDEKVF